MVILYGKVFMKIRTKNALWNQKSIKKEKSKDIKQIETCIIKKNSAVKMSLLATQEDNLNSESIISLNQLGNVFETFQPTIIKSSCSSGLTIFMAMASSLQPTWGHTAGNKACNNQLT